MSRLRQQRRGKGASNYKNHKAYYRLKYLPDIENKNYVLNYIFRDPSKSTTIGKYTTDDNTTFYNVAPLTVYEKQKFDVNNITIGSITLLKNIMPGYEVCNISTEVNGDGKLLRAPGCCGKIIKQQSNLTYIKLKDKIISMDNKCMATVGKPGGGGHTLKPLLKAGTNHKRLKGCAKKSREVSAKNKNHHEHPFGASKSKSPGRPKTCSRSSPPGAKVGSIAARRTGKK